MNFFCNLSQPRMVVGKNQQFLSVTTMTFAVTAGECIQPTCSGKHSQCFCKVSILECLGGLEREGKVDREGKVERKGRVERDRC